VIPAKTYDRVDILTDGKTRYTFIKMGSQLTTVFDGQISIDIVAQKFLAFLAIHFPNLGHVAPDPPARRSCIYQRNSIKVFSNHGETAKSKLIPSESGFNRFAKPLHHPHNLVAQAGKEGGRNMKLLWLILLPKQCT
jgi:hypothetical protein